MSPVLRLIGRFWRADGMRSAFAITLSAQLAASPVMAQSAPPPPPALQIAPAPSRPVPVDNPAPANAPAALTAAAGAAMAKGAADAAVLAVNAAKITAANASAATSAKSAAAAAAITTAAAATPPGPSDLLGAPGTPVASFNGSYTQDIPIEVPAYHGVEPHLRLTYDSSRSMGAERIKGAPLGVGWAIAGLSEITRGTRGGGTPNFDTAAVMQTTDVFLLDGAEMVKCGPANVVSPGCAAGGTHAARVESYQRIAYSTDLR